VLVEPDVVENIDELSGAPDRPAMMNSLYAADARRAAIVDATGITPSASRRAPPRPDCDVAAFPNA
jgi:hypothetical protein